MPQSNRGESGGGGGGGDPSTADSKQDVIFSCKRGLMTLTEVLANYYKKKKYRIKLSLFEDKIIFIWR